MLGTGAHAQLLTRGASSKATNFARYSDRPGVVNKNVRQLPHLKDETPQAPQKERKLKTSEDPAL